MASKTRTEEEKKEIYKRWCDLINMSEDELKSWAKNPNRLKASLNRIKAKANGGIQSGLDSLHRIKRRFSKPRAEWSAKDYDNASQENSFNSRMLGNDPGKIVSDTGMSKWEISLRNWGHDPSKKSSPAYSKWKSWKESNKEALKKTSSEIKEFVTELTSSYLWERGILANRFKEAAEVLGMDRENGLGVEEAYQVNKIVDSILNNPSADSYKKQAAEMWHTILSHETSNIMDERKDAEALFILAEVLSENKYQNLKVGSSQIPGEVNQKINTSLENNNFQDAFQALQNFYNSEAVKSYSGGPLTTQPDYGATKVATKNILSSRKTPIEK